MLLLSVQNSHAIRKNLQPELLHSSAFGLPALECCYQVTVYTEKR